MGQDIHIEANVTFDTINHKSFEIGCHVFIGANMVIAAGSVVTKDIPDDCLVGGPAKVIRKFNV